LGRVAAASALEGQGTPLDRAAQVPYLAGLATGVGVAALGLWGLATMGYTKWMVELAGPLAILAAAYFVTRAVRGAPDGPPTLRERVRAARESLLVVASQRVLAVKLLLTSTLASFAFAGAIYLITQ